MVSGEGGSSPALLEGARSAETSLFFRTMEGEREIKEEWVKMYARVGETTRKRANRLVSGPIQKTIGRINSFASPQHAGIFKRKVNTRNADSQKRKARQRIKQRP